MNVKLCVVISDGRCNPKAAELLPILSNNKLPSKLPKNNNFKEYHIHWTDEGNVHNHLTRNNPQALMMFTNLGTKNYSNHWYFTGLST